MNNFYYIMYNGQVVGPLSKDQLAAYNVNQNTQVCVDGQTWLPLSSFPELMPLVAGRPAPPQASGDSNKLVCGLLAILFGGLGIHYFIIGKTAAGFINILLAVVTCGIWSLINLIQGIMILCMSEDEWRRKFVNSTSTFPVF